MEAAALPMKKGTEAFWEEFAKKHRPETVKLCRIFSVKKLTEQQFATLLSSDHKRMPPSKARAIWRYLKECDVLEYPDVSEDDQD